MVKYKVISRIVAGEDCFDKSIDFYDVDYWMQRLYKFEFTFKK